MPCYALKNYFRVKSGTLCTYKVNLLFVFQSIGSTPSAKQTGLKLVQNINVNVLFSECIMVRAAKWDFKKTLQCTLDFLASLRSQSTSFKYCSILIFRVHQANVKVAIEDRRIPHPVLNKQVKTCAKTNLNLNCFIFYILVMVRLHTCMCIVLCCKEWLEVIQEQS